MSDKLSDYSTSLNPSPSPYVPPPGSGDQSAGKSKTSRKEKKFLASLDPKQYLETKTSIKGIKGLFGTKRVTTTEAGIRTLEKFSEKLKNQKKLNETDKENLIKNANKIYEYLIKNNHITADLDDKNAKRMQAILLENPHLLITTTEKNLEETDFTITRLLDSNLLTTEIATKLRAQSRVINRLIQECAKTEEGPKKRIALQQAILTAMPSNEELASYCRTLIKDFEAKEIAKVEQVNQFQEGETVDVSGLEDEYQKLLPLFSASGMGSDELASITTRHRGLIENEFLGHLDRLYTENESDLHTSLQLIYEVSKSEYILTTENYLIVCLQNLQKVLETHKGELSELSHDEKQMIREIFVNCFIRIALRPQIVAGFRAPTYLANALYTNKQISNQSQISEQEEAAIQNRFLGYDMFLKKMMRILLKKLENA